MQSLTNYTDVAAEVADYLLARAAEAERRGVARNNIILDPGFGFAKSVEQNYTLLSSLSKLCKAGYAVLAGLSRKSMIYKVADSTPEQSLAGTLALNWEALRQGATILRVHDVAEAVQIAKIFRIYSNDKGYRYL
jgi:dihydropteroate synthase